MARSSMLDCCDDLVGREEIVFEEALEEDAAHLACSEDGDAEAGHESGLRLEFVFGVAHPS